MLLNGTKLKKTFAGETLFEDVSFEVHASDKIGFVGVNGAGKSTLFKMIAGTEDYDEGEIFKSRETRVGYLRQHAVSDGDTSVMDEVLKVFSEVMDIERQLDDVCLKLEESSTDVDALVARQAALQERFIQLDGTHYRSKAKGALAGLGFAEKELSMPLSKLSGGQKTRIALCKILLSDANLLLLDEPTNHLDVDSIEWLENFLANYKGAFVVVSHDRYFLDKVTNRTFELKNGHLRAYSGNYSAYIVQREIERLTEQRDYDYAVREIRRLEEVVEQQRRWKHKKNKKTHTLSNTRKAIERIEETLAEPENDPDAMRFKFKACPGGGRSVLEMKGVAMGFGENELFENVDASVEKGEKVFLLGPNGCGKTTLLKIIMGLHGQNRGTCKIGENVRIGYYDQLRENLHREKTVINEIWDEYPDLSQTQVRSALAMFLFKGDDVFKEIRSLSGGELARVELAKLLLKPVNFLIMDEPTNHLDTASREALETALADYDGTMLMVSHDRYFINKLADRILYLTPGGIVEYAGDYDDFIASRQAEAAKQAPQRAERKAPNSSDRKNSEAQKRKTVNRFANVEKLIDKTEAEIKELSQASTAPEIASDYVRLSEISDQIASLQAKLDEYMEEWETLQLTIDEMGYSV